MGTKPARKPEGSLDAAALMERYGCGAVRFVGAGEAFYERHLQFDNIVACSRHRA